MEDAISVAKAEIVKKAVDLQVIVDGNLGDPDLCEGFLAEGKLDFIGLGRPLRADPEWPQKVRGGKPEEICLCIRCMDCFTRTNAGKFIGYSVNARLGREREWPVMLAPTPKKILVVGGRPGGMEAARTAARRGHDVTLVEKDNNLGGHLLEASAPALKSLIAKYRLWLERQVRKSGVKVQVGLEATAELVQEMHPDVIIVATGSVPSSPNVPGIDRKNVVQAVNFLRGEVRVGPKVVIVGGGLVGCEAALCLSGVDKSIVIIEMLPEILADVSIFSKFTLMEKMREVSIRWLTATNLLEINENEVVAENSLGKNNFVADTIILATGFLADDQLHRILEDKGYEVYKIGDCLNPGKIFDAVHNAYTIAKDL